MQDCGPGFVLTGLVQIWCSFVSVGVSFVKEVSLSSQGQSINHSPEIPA